MSDPVDNADGQSNDQGDGEQSKDRNFDAMFADHRKRTVRDVNASLDQRMQGFVTKDDFSSFQKSVLDVLGGKSNPEPQPEGDDKGEKKKDGKHETPSDVQMKKLASTVEQQRAELEKLQTDLQKKEEEAMLASDHRALDDLFAKSGVPAELARQARTLFLTDHAIIRDEEKGRVHEVKGEYGPEFVTPDELVPKWLDENPHFFGTRKSGSGAGGNAGNQRASRPLDLTKMADNPEEYIKNRDEIHRKLEGQ